uniref:Mannosyltransferase n=1 Tax=Meloidogyne javanica TaxID=6303 RepID=A0A915MDC0_MELJA
MAIFRHIIQNCFQNLRYFGTHELNFCRHKSFWCNNRGKETTKFFDGLELEKLFVDENVQKLLKSLCGFDLNRLYSWRLINSPSRRHYALMTDNMYKEFLFKMASKAQYFLQFVPLKEPRPNKAETLSVDSDIAGHDPSKIIFVDISHDSTERDRAIVVREPNGRLRTALPEEHFRMNRIFFDKPDRPVREPPLFHLHPDSDGKIVCGDILLQTLARDEHEFVLDWACNFYEPDDHKFVELCKCIFENTIKKQKLSVLHSTRHFGTLAFYMIINNYYFELIEFFAQNQNISGVANTIRLLRIIYPNWTTTIPSNFSDLDVLKEYLNQIEQQINDNKELKQRFSSNIQLPKNFALLKRSENQRISRRRLQENSSFSSNVSSGEDDKKELSHDIVTDWKDSDWAPSISAVFKILFSIRLSASLWSIISDCDEVYNYWEPLHLVLFKRGFQTWEYSPVYGIRSWLYILLYAGPAKFLIKIFPDSKVALFFSLRFLIRSLSIFCTAISALIGWPFSAILGLPIVIEMLIIRKRKLALKFLFYSILFGLLICLLLFIVDTHFFGRPVLAPLNIIFYNIFSSNGPNLYGKEPISFYLKNLFLNFNIAFILAIFAIPFCLFFLIIQKINEEKYKKEDKTILFKNYFGNNPLKQWERFRHLIFLSMSATIWMLIFMLQPHKEERFLFPIYPHICLLAAICLD